MSKGFPQRSVRNALIGLAVVAVLPVLAQAAEQSRTPSRVPTPSASRSFVRPGTRTPASFTPEMPLSEAIDILRNCTSPPLNIIVLWRDLDSAGIYRDTPIGIDGLSGLRISRYLDMLVLSMSAGAADKIGYAVHGGVITIATTRALPASRQMTRVYDIRDLTAPPANYSFPPMGFGGGMGLGGGMGFGGGMLGNQMMGLNGGYGGGLGTGYGFGSSSMSGGGFSGMGGFGGLPGMVGNSYGTRMR